MVCILRAPGSCFVNETGAPVHFLNSPLVLGRQVLLKWKASNPRKGAFPAVESDCDSAAFIILLWKCYAFRSKGLVFGVLLILKYIYDQMFMGKTSGTLGRRCWSRCAICVAFCIWPLLWPGGWQRSQIIVGFMSNRSPKQCVLQQLGLTRTPIPEC